MIANDNIGTLVPMLKNVISIIIRYKTDKILFFFVIKYAISIGVKIYKIVLISFAELNQPTWPTFAIS